MVDIVYPSLHYLIKTPFPPTSEGDPLVLLPHLIKPPLPPTSEGGPLVVLAAEMEHPAVEVLVPEVSGPSGALEPHGGQSEAAGGGGIWGNIHF